MLKSYPKGILVLLQPEPPFEELKEKLAEKFSQARGFFGAASLALTFEGRQLSRQEESSLVDVIRRNSDIQVICVVGTDEATGKHFVKALQKVRENLRREDEIQVYRGDLQEGESLDASRGAILIGDVCRGAVLRAGGSVLVLGGLYGEIRAGCSGGEGVFVAALEMEPEKLTIGDFKYKPAKAKWGRRAKNPAKAAYIKDDRILMEPLDRSALRALCP